VVNFWKPSGKSFHAVAEGDYFFFKAKKPINHVVGGGVYGGYAISTLSEAWRSLGEANGADSYERLAKLVKKGADPVIGCTFVHNPVFYRQKDAFSTPPDWSSNIQTGKSYDMSDRRYAAYFAELMQFMPRSTAELAPDVSWVDDGPVFGVPHLTPTRIKQNAFRLVVSTAYQNRCAITGSKIRPALQAAHILPVTEGGKNRLDNGLLLRSDVHAMFDGGYLGVDPAYRLRVSPRLRDDFGNGEQFYAQAGQDIALPEHRADRPQREYLEWHLDTVFKAS
jgi:putative restriction endonuclease